MADGRSVLVVDDSEASRYVTAGFLRRAGFAVSEASTGGEALRSIDAVVPDLVVLDVNLPDISGFEVCERVKADPRTAATPVLHVSATATHVSDRAAGLTRGADAYLVEPFEPEELLATVGALLRYADARRRSERLTELLQWLTEEMLAVHAATTLDATITRTMDMAARVLGADEVVLLVRVDHERVSFRRRSGHAIEGFAMGAEEFDAATGGPLGFPAPDLPPLTGPHEVARIPLSASSQTTPGLLAIGRSSPLDDPARLVLPQLALAVSVALDKARLYEHEHRTAEELQRSLLPADFPSVPGFEIAARYEPGDTVGVGGDWYEAFELDDGKLALAIGDVAGRGLGAASMMAYTRAWMRAAAFRGGTPAQVLTYLNRLVMRYEAGQFVTACYLVVDTSTGAVDFANAGHLPPLTVTRAGTHEFFEDPDPPLGIRDGDYRDQVAHLERGGLLVLCTDGLVERRRESIDGGLDRLARTAVETRATNAVNVADALVAALRDTGQPYDDDMALVVLRRLE